MKIKKKKKLRKSKIRKQIQKNLKMRIKNKTNLKKRLLTQKPRIRQQIAQKELLIHQDILVSRLTQRFKLKMAQFVLLDKFQDCFMMMVMENVHIL